MKLSRHKRRDDIRESSIGALEFRVFGALVPQNLEHTKDRLLSILQSFRPEGKEEQAVSSFLERVVNQSLEIFILLQMVDNVPPSVLTDLHKVLEDVKGFVGSINRCKSYSCPIAKFAAILTHKSSSIERQLEAIFDTLEASLLGDEIQCPPASSLGQRTDSLSMAQFSGAHDFTMNDAKIFSANNIYIAGDGTGNAGCLESHCRDVILEKEIYIGKGYRLHRGKTNGKIVVAKVFEGHHAEQLCSKTAELNNGVMHPNLLRIFGGPNHDLGPVPRFLLFDGDCEGTVETELPRALLDGIRTTWIMGVNTVIGCARALLYLENTGFPLPLMKPEQFIPIVSKEGKVVINLDANGASDAASDDDNESLPTARTSRVIQIYNKLIQKTFYASCEKFYPIERVYNDEGTQHAAPPLESEVETEEHSTDSSKGSSQSATEKSGPKSEGHRRELIWKSHNTSSWSLEKMSQSYEASLVRFRSENALACRRGHPIAHVAHRCPGYKRTEIIFSPNIDQSGVVSHTSPVPNEICLVCGERVEEKEIFNCRCGSLNNDVDISRPTIKCTVCLQWQHRDCMEITTNAQMRDYKCGRCLASGNQPLQPPQLQPQQQQPHQNMARLANGLPAGGMQPGMARPQSAYLANGAMPNGAGMGGRQQQQQPGGSGGQMNFAGMGGHPPPPQANGVPAPGPGGPQQLQPGQQPPAGGPPGQSMQFSVLPGQRPIMNGLTPQQQQQQQRPGPNEGLGPFQSPTLAHSPGQPPQPGQQPTPGAPGQQAPMAQLGPSPHMPPMNRGGSVGMAPLQPSNGGPPDMAVAPPPLQQQQGGQPQGGGPPTPGYQPGQTPNPSGRPPSRSNTPRSGGLLTQASPSLPARQTPGGNPMMGVVPMNMAGMVGGPGPSNPGGVNALNHENAITSDIMTIPQNTLNLLKMELGFGDKDFGSLSMTEKIRTLSHWRTKTVASGGKPGPIPNLGPQGQPPQRAGGPPPPPQQRVKRSSTSPGERHETLPRNESSLPNRKRLRRSPADTPIMGYPHPGQPQPPLAGQPVQQMQQPGQPPQPTREQVQQMNMLLTMRAQHPTMGMPSGPAPGGPMQQPGQPQLHQGGLMGMHPGAGPMIPTQQQQQMHIYRMKQEPFNPLPQPPAGSTPQFTSSPLNRIGQTKPPMTMMPPPSPAQGGPPKGIKAEGNDGSNGLPQSQATLNPDGSPRNAPPAAGGPSNGGTAPPTPVPTNRPNPQQQQQQQQQPQPSQSQPQPPLPRQQAPPPQLQPNPNPMAAMMSSPLSMLGMSGPSMNLGQTDMMFDTLTGMEDFDTTYLFPRDTSSEINFERDFALWFNHPEDLTGGLGPD